MPSAKKKAPQKKGWRNAVGGGLAAAISRTIVSPLERLRMSMITDGSRFASNTDCLRSIYKAEGIKGFWAGNGVNMIRIIPQNAVAFYCKDYYKKKIGGSNPNGWQLMAASCLSGCTCITAIYPLDIARGRITTSPGVYKGLGDCMRRMVKAEGVQVLFAGIWPANVWAVPYYGMFFWTYDSLRKWYMNWGVAPGAEPNKINPAVHGVAFGALSGITSVTAAFPFELIRRRLQVQGVPDPKTGVPRPMLYKGVMDSLRGIVAKEGVAGLFNGCTANCIKMAPANAVTFACYEVIIDQLQAF